MSQSSHIGKELLTGCDIGLLLLFQLSLYNCSMNKQLATTVFESLASGVRLDIYRLLVKAGPQGLVAGEIGSALAVPPTNLSFHLKALTHAQLVSVVQEGRYQRYRANLALMQQLIVYLTAECCAGHPEQCFEACPEPLCA
jgi:DNA-binding transcriptional ArsR family regulator